MNRHIESQLDDLTPSLVVLRDYQTGKITREQAIEKLGYALEFIEPVKGSA